MVGDTLRHTYKLTIAYDGGNYCGWQVQPNGPTVQAALQDAFAILFKEKIHVTGSGRTDQGVHALGQCAHVHIPVKIDIKCSLLSLNGILPREIRILSIEEVENTFHARFSSRGKVYRYNLTLDSVQNPFRRLYSWHLRRKVDIDLLKTAAKKFEGEHDFTSFANEPHRGSASHNAIRTIYNVNFLDEPDGIALEFIGSGFLYKMVRNIVGTVVDVAANKLPLGAIDAIFAAKDRRTAPHAAPPHGLFLMQVFY